MQGVSHNKESCFKYSVIECVPAMIPVTIKQKVVTDNIFHPLLSEIGIFAERPSRWMLLYVQEERETNNCYHKILYVVPLLVLSSVLHLHALESLLNQGIHNMMA